MTRKYALKVLLLDQIRWELLAVDVKRVAPMCHDTCPVLAWANVEERGEPAVYVLRAPPQPSGQAGPAPLRAPLPCGTQFNE